MISRFTYFRVGAHLMIFLFYLTLRSIVQSIMPSLSIGNVSITEAVLAFVTAHLFIVACGASIFTTSTFIMLGLYVIVHRFVPLRLFLSLAWLGAGWNGMDWRWEWQYWPKPSIILILLAFVVSLTYSAVRGGLRLKKTGDVNVKVKAQ